MFEIDKNYKPLDRLLEWDEATRSVIEERLRREMGTKSSFDFLSPEEGVLLQKIAEVMVGLPETGSEIKIAEVLDRRLSRLETGVKYNDNPWPYDFYKKGLKEFEKNIKDEAQKKSIATTEVDIEMLIGMILEGNGDRFLSNFLRKVLRDATEIYYSHPQSWVEIGFPGPAYPAGYPFLSCDTKEDWEPVYHKI